MQHDATSLKKFLERLKSKRRELEIALDQLLLNQKDYFDHTAGEGVADESDYAQREIMSFSNYELIDRKSKELKQIDYLLQKISRDEDFGICEECEEPIPLGRLLLVPGATLCVACQSEMEEFDHSRRQFSGTSYGYKGKTPHEWKEYDEMEGADDDLIDPDFDMVPDFDEPAPGADELNHGPSEEPDPSETRIKH